MIGNLVKTSRENYSAITAVSKRNVYFEIELNLGGNQLSNVIVCANQFFDYVMLPLYIAQKVKS